MNTTQSKTEFLTEAMIEQVNDLQKVASIENNRNFYSVLTYDVAKKYIKVWQSDCYDGVVREGRRCFMFIDKETGAVYKPASYKAPAKGIRFFLESLVENPEIVDPYGSFLYVR
tara:strand:- start:407 stop:748 length:342 start_codon:yes stop_codon:yes gene_type:complete